MFTHRKAASNPDRKAFRAGFTLLEVLAAMALIMLVIGGVYGISGAAVELGRSMSEARIVETRVTNFVSVWRDYFENLPPDIRFSAGVEKVARGGAGALMIEGGPMPFAWHQALRMAEAVEFRVEAAADRQLTLMVRHLQKPERPVRPDDYEVVAELPLLEGLEEMRWQFYEPLDEEWFSNWDPNKRPEPPLFLRMQFRLSEDPRTHEHVFWVANDLQRGRVDLGGRRP
jgi:prepilin-type N-terminal cleavage/methylation domain-containing protein